jgi:hypothetical protein
MSKHDRRYMVIPLSQKVIAVDHNYHNDKYDKNSNTFNIAKKNPT